MLNLKYFNPKIDTQSLMSSYQEDNLKSAQENFGITDIFATYSWGFNQKTEKTDYQFFHQSLKTFNKLNLKIHAYIQGPPLVYKQHSQNWWARDDHHRLIPYHRGRKLVCLNNPEFLDYQLNKIKSLKDQPITGIYMDNILMGQLPLPIYNNNLPVTFAGCNCHICQQLFKQETGEKLPTDMQANPELTNLYLNWRAQRTTSFIKALSQFTHSLKFTFGINNYDPSLDPHTLYGQDLNSLSPYLDYFFFETLSFPKDKHTSNSYAQMEGSKYHEPTFVESYKSGIGLDSVYSQADFDLLYTESLKRKFNLAIKASEYLTNQNWHNLDPKAYTKLKKVPLTLYKHHPKKLNLPQWTYPFLKQIYNPLTTFTFENKYGRLLQDHLLKQTFS